MKLTTTEFLIEDKMILDLIYKDLDAKIAKAEAFPEKGKGYIKITIIGVDERLKDPQKL